MISGNSAEKQAQETQLKDAEASPCLTSNEELAFALKRRKLVSGEQVIMTETPQVDRHEEVSSSEPNNKEGQSDESAQINPPPAKMPEATSLAATKPVRQAAN